RLREKTLPAQVWAGAEVAMRHPIALAIAAGVGLIVSYLVMPITLGIVYFRHPSASPQTFILIIRCVLVMAFSFYPVMLMFTVAPMTSANMDPEVRGHLFFSAITSIIPTSLYLALGLWAFGVGETGSTISINLGAITPMVSVRNIVFILAFFALTTLLP